MHHHFSFLCRDGYGNMDFQEQLLTTVRTDKSTRAYLRKNAQEREQMYLQLQTSLQTNRGQQSDDERSTNSSSTRS